jgi:pSer/pThr/pTyr-binding forkhead associated (FHA) protein
MPVNGRLIPLGQGVTIPLIRDCLVIGRRASSDICLRFPKVSGRHAQLEFRNDHWHIRDLGSNNGVKVNGARIRAVRLRPGDIVSIGKCEFKIDFKDDSEEDDAAGTGSRVKPPKPSGSASAARVPPPLTS